MVFEAGEYIEGFRSAEGERMKVGQTAYVVDGRRVRAGVLLYRRAIGALVFIDGTQWHSRVGIYATRENAAAAAKGVRP